MTGTYLGEFPVDVAASEFASFMAADWALYFIGRYGQIEGDHHRTWVLDQVVRILNGTPVHVVEARWTDHPPEYRVTTGEPSEAYREWVRAMKAPDPGESDEYTYDVGIPP